MTVPYAYKNVYSSRHSRRTCSIARSATRTLAASNHNQREKKVAKKKKQRKHQAPHNVSRNRDEDDVSTVLSIPPHLAHDENGGRFPYLPAQTNVSAQPYAPTLSRRQKRLLRKKLDKVGVPSKICVSRAQNHRHAFGSFDSDGDDVSTVSAPFYYASDDQRCVMDDSENMNLPYVSLHQVLETAKERHSQSLCLIRMLEEEQHGKNATADADDDDSSSTSARPFEVSFPNHHTKDFSSIKLQEGEIFVFLAAMLEYDSDKWTFEIQLWPPSGVQSRTTGEHILDDLAFLINWCHHHKSPVVDNNSNENLERCKPWQSDWEFDGSSLSADDERMNDFNIVSFDFLDE